MSHLSALPFVSADDFSGVISYREAVDGLEATLRSGEGTRHTPLRTRTDVPSGHLLYMPAQVGEAVGVKLASVSDTNPGRGLPRIQGLVIVSDAETLRPSVIFDAAGFTVLRTASLSALAVRHLAKEDASTLLVFGAGPQAWGHIEAIRTVRRVERVIIVGRSPERAHGLLNLATEAGLQAEIGTSESVAEADIIACCTSARAPLFDSASLREDATVVAIGSHSPDAREVDTALVTRAFTAVETRTSAFAEAGDIILACADGVSAEQAVNAELAEVVAQPRTATTGLRLFKGVGEAWSDVVIATLAAAKLGLGPSH